MTAEDVLGLIVEYVPGVRGPSLLYIQERAEEVLTDLRSHEPPRATPNEPSDRQDADSAERR